MASANVFVGARSRPTVVNAYRNGAEVCPRLWLPASRRPELSPPPTVSDTHRSDVGLHTQFLLSKIGIRLGQKTKINILKNVSGVLQPASAERLAQRSVASMAPSLPHLGIIAPANAVPLVLLFPATLLSLLACAQSRLTLLLGPPGAGKTTLMKALAGKLDGGVKVRRVSLFCRDCWFHAGTLVMGHC